MAFQAVADSLSREQELGNVGNDGDGIPFDVFLGGSEADSTAIPAHRAVLSGRSTFFRAMFSSCWPESRQDHVRLHTIPGPILSMLVKSAYGSDVTIDEATVVPLLQDAHFVGLEPLVETCFNFLKRNINRDNCLMVYRLAEIYRCADVSTTAKNHALRHFSYASQRDKFLELDKDMVTGLIASDKVNVEHEDAVLDAVFSWILNDPDERTPMLTELLYLVRLVHVKPHHLQTSVDMFIGQLGHIFPNLSDQLHRTIQTALSIKCRPRVSCEFSRVFLHFSNIVRCIDPRTGSVTPIEYMPAGLITAGVAVMGREVYALGSIEGHPVLYEYHLDCGTWMSLAEPLSAHFGGGMVVLAGRIYAMGGKGTQQSSRDGLKCVECYDPITDVWKRVASLPVGLCAFGVVVHQGSVFTFGGKTSQGRKTVYRYDPQSDVWTKYGEMPEPRYDCSACLGDDDMVYILGGMSRKLADNSWHPNTNLDAFDPRTNEWKHLGRSPTTGTRLVVGAANGYLYVFGGGAQQTHDWTHSSANGIHAYDVGTRTWSPWTANSSSSFYSSTCAVVQFKKARLRNIHRFGVRSRKVYDDKDSAERKEDDG